MTTVQHGSATDVGRVRSINEDRALDGPRLFAVADGMGGHAAGEIAAGVALDALRSSFEHDPSEAGVVDGVKSANQAVWEMAQSDASLRGMGTTITTAALVADGEEEYFTVANVGDSRAYIYHAGKLVQLTMDHSVAEEMVRRGELSAAAALVHPHRHILTRALGVGPVVDLDGWRIFANAGDRLLLCSDGLTNEVEDHDIAAVLARLPSPEEAASELVALANAHGGSDNVTVVIVDILAEDQGGEERTTAAAATATPPPLVVAPIEGLEPPPALAKRRTAAVAEALRRASSHAARTVQASQDAGSPAAAGPLAATGTPGAPAAGDATDVSPSRLRATDHEHPPGHEHPPDHRRFKRAPRERADRMDKRFTLRVFAFFVVLAVILAGAAGVVYWYAESSYYVGLRGNRIGIYQGRPGGLFGIKPRLVHKTNLTTTKVLPTRIPDLKQGVKEPSIAAAEQYVTNLEQEYASTIGAHRKHASTSRPAPTTSTTGTGSTGTGSTGTGSTGTGSTGSIPPQGAARRRPAASRSTPDGALGADPLRPDALTAVTT